MQKYYVLSLRFFIVFAILSSQANTTKADKALSQHESYISSDNGNQSHIYFDEDSEQISRAYRTTKHT